MIVTIDGTAGAGKSTTAKLTAERLGFRYIDTGATYRAVALAVMKKGINPKAKAEVEKLSSKVKIKFKDTKIFLDEENVTQAIRSEEVGKLASLCATYKGVRKNMVQLQRKLAQSQHVICEGRDIGTVVFPNADVKIYLDAKPEIRAARRQKELLGRGINKDMESTFKDLRLRDKQDKLRKHSPLKIPQGAIIINTTNLTIEEVVEKVVKIIKTYETKIQDSHASNLLGMEDSVRI